MPFFIKQLTGVRFIAAAWVVLYHYQPAIAAAGLLFPLVHEFLRVGSLGVDLFFALSGFILTHTYLTKIGPKFTWKGAGNFLWLRLARIYPAHFVMLNIAGLAVLAAAIFGKSDAADRSWLNPWAYIKQLLLIQEWGANPDRGWNFVAWSLSMEWLAYIIFTLLVLVLWRVRDRLPVWALALIAFICLLPLLYIGLTRTDDPFLTTNWGSSIRVLTEFWSGAFAYLVVRRLYGSKQSAGSVETATAGTQAVAAAAGQTVNSSSTADNQTTENGGPSRNVVRTAGILTWVIPIAIVVISIVLGNIPALQWENLPNEAPRAYIIIVPFLVVWIAALALAKNGIVSFLSTERLLLGGFISYSLYLVHLVWYGLWRTAMSAVGITGGPLYWVGLVGLIVMAIVFAWLLWRFVEEPAREWMRSKIGAKKKPIEESGTTV